VLDVLVVGAGPAGRAVAAACGERGLTTRMIDPAPGRPWRATYGAWRDELPGDLPDSVLAATVPGRAVTPTPGHRGTPPGAPREHPLPRRYAVFEVPALRAHLDQRLATADVRVDRALARPGGLPEAGLVIDAGGPAQPLSDPSPGRRRVRAEQTAAGVVVTAELAAPVLAPDEALFMDWRQPRGAPGDWPTFLYAVPLGGGRVLLEETSLARRPGLAPELLAARLAARLAGHGITVPAGAPREIVRFPVDLPRHRAAGVLGFGAAAPLTHPATGYQLAESLRLAPAVAAAAADALDGAGGPAAALAAARAVVWPAGARAVYLLRRRGLEALLRLPPRRLPEFFDGFFRLPPARQHAYLSGRCDAVGTLAAMAGTFGTTGWEVRLRLIGSSLLVRAPAHCSERSSVE
jgi:lycopene beta-cyclase